MQSFCNQSLQLITAEITSQLLRSKFRLNIVEVKWLKNHLLRPKLQITCPVLKFT
jgi:hypothetical protein